MKPLIEVLHASRNINNSVDSVDPADSASSADVSVPAQEQRGRLRLVDFACGSGALLLPLASALPEVDFVGVDM